MNDVERIRAILSQYEKHGWILRRILISESFRSKLGNSDGELFGKADIIRSDLDAAWFSRSSSPGKETWELRFLGNSPYAIDSFLDDGMNASLREEILKNTEGQMRDARPISRGN
jgi:hypothetical protein